jgi:hypothetical protein
MSPDELDSIAFAAVTQSGKTQKQEADAARENPDREVREEGSRPNPNEKGDEQLWGV